MRKLALQFFYYVIVGGIAFVVDVSTLYILTEYAGLHYLVSASVGFLLGLLINYALCIFWIFDFRALAKARHEFGVFAAIGLAGLALNNSLLSLLTEIMGLHYLISKVCAAAFVLMFNFGLRRQILFSNNRDTGHPSHDSMTGSD